MYFIERGVVEIFIPDSSGKMIRLRTINSGMIVGEMSLYLDSPRSATVITKVPCQIYRLSLEKMHLLEIKSPDAASMLHRYVAVQSMKRLSYANALISVLL